MYTVLLLSVLNLTFLKYWKSMNVEKNLKSFLAFVCGSCVLMLTYVSENILNTPTDALGSPYVY